MNRVGLLVAGHGSRDNDGVAECSGLAARVAALRAGLDVALGFIELAPPPISDAVGRLVAGGVDDVTVVPLVLLGAGHAKTDVPAAVVRARRSHPDVRFRYGAPLGIHPHLIDMVDERVSAAVAPTAATDAATDTAVLLVGRGSTDPDANGDLAKVARLVWEGRSYSVVECAFVGLTEPRVAPGLERCRRLGARRIVVVPYFLFTGLLVRRIEALARAFAAANPDVDVTVTPHLGVDDRIARLVLARFDRARDGLDRPNCDVCQYRVALPGFEHRVGAPQTLHAHPREASSSIAKGASPPGREAGWSIPKGASPPGRDAGSSSPKGAGPPGQDAGSSSPKGASPPGRDAGLLGRVGGRRR